MTKKTENQNKDLESALHDAHLCNDTVDSISWSGINVHLKDKATKAQKYLIQGLSGDVKAGELVAIMGPSGSGKSTLLNSLAHRALPKKSTMEGSVMINRAPASLSAIRRLSCYVEQEDSLIGSLTARETLDFAAKLSLPSSVSKVERRRRVDGLLEAFGLKEQADTIIGTPIRKGLSGGQKRRVGIASQLITCPKILFLDEPTSGLDSAASREVIRYLKDVVKKNRIIVIASIHQPSTSTYTLFDTLFLLSRGKTCFGGPISNAAPHFESLSYPMPMHINPAEFLLDLINVDFAADRSEADARLSSIHTAWDTHTSSQSHNSETGADAGKPPGITISQESLSYPMPMHINPAEFLLNLINVDFAADRSEADARLSSTHTAWDPRTSSQYHNSETGADAENPPGVTIPQLSRKSKLLIPFTLLNRNFIKSYRDVFAYGIRIAMYLGLAIMVGTIWLRLGTTQESIQPFINSIFFGAAFISFMAVAYVPAYLEDLSTFHKERANGLYGPTAFIIANFLIGLPYLFLISLLFSIIAYWLCNFRPTADAFFTWIMWLFLDLVAAESLVVLVSSLFPIFVVALALTAFANGLWMSVGGFLVSPKVLNVFWRYWARYIDYQSYVFQGMMVNEFSARTYSCAKSEGPGGCTCMYQSDLADQCRIRGQAVLDTYGYRPGHMGKWVGILLAIVVGYRVLGWVVLTLKR